MSDDLRIPDVGLADARLNPRDRAPLSSSYGGGYRSRRSGTEPGLNIVKVAAAGLGGLLLLGVVSYSLMGRHSSGVPVIEADSRPVRVKPDNPGGMQIAGADELSLSDDRTSHDTMAPAAEVPAPQALRAQMQQTAPAAAPASPVKASPSPQASALQPTGPAPGPAPAVAPYAATAGASPPADTPPPPATKSLSASEPGRTVARQDARPATKPSDGTTMVQLGALSSEEAARSEWHRLEHLQPALLDGREPLVTKVERDGRTYWRLRTGGFTDIADATEFCTKMKAKGGACAIASF